MFAEIVTIGDELCRGEIVDTNSSWLAGELWDRSITVRWMSSCRDEKDDMARVLGDAAARADVVLVSGGLGPTEDDLTVDVVAALAGTEVVTDEPALARMKARFEAARFQLTPNNLRQVRVPASARSLGNPAGLAPGFEISIGKTPFFVMPGVPREMKAIFADAVSPRLQVLVAGQERVARRLYRVFGIGESHIDHALSGITSNVAGATVHYQVSFPETLVKLVVRDPSADAAQQRLDALDADLRARLGDKVYGEGTTGLPAVVGQALQLRGATVTVAESCTGGLLGALLTEVPGSSAYFKGGWITYANETKQRDLGVQAATLATEGAVSRACVEEMAAGARERAGTDYAAAISGIAGPDGGTAEKPVGTVHVAVAGPSGTRHKHFVYPGVREQVRRLAAYWALALLLGEITR